MKKVFFCLLFFSTSFLYAQDTNPYDIYIASKFLYRTHTYNNFTIPYRLFIPENYDPAKSYPLVLALHGSGERGSDNNRQILAWRLATSWADSNNQKNYPVIVVAPQCPVDSSWVSAGDFDHSVELAPIAVPLAAANDIINNLYSELNIDTTRLYVTGLSMGGFGAWDLVMRYPERFAAAIPMSGAGDLYGLANIIHLPVWSFHGKIDDAVPVEESDRLINKLMLWGRQTVFTHCNIRDCIIIDSSAIASELQQGHDLIYTKFEQGGHTIWRESYDYPLLFPWVFKQYHLSNRINFTFPATYEAISGKTVIRWQSTDAESKADIYISIDNGTEWSAPAKSVTNSGSFELDTKNFPDAAFAILKIVLRDKDNVAYSDGTSVPFRINNSGNGKPYVKIFDSHFAYSRLVQDSLSLKFLAADPDNDSLNLLVYYSNNGKNNFENVLSSVIKSGKDTQNVNINLKKLLNSSNAYFIVKVNDTEFSFSDTSAVFSKISGRDPLSPSYIINNGNFDVPFVVNVIDDSKINGDEYRITFDDIFSPTDKFYSVFNLTKNSFEIENERIINGADSKIFGGYSFVTEDTKTYLNQHASGWSKNAVPVTFTMTPFTINSNYPQYNGYAAPADYLVEFSDQDKYTSVADTLMIPNQVIYPARQVNFRVLNLLTNQYPDFVTFVTGSINKVHTIYLKEKASFGEARTWRIVLYGSSDRIGTNGDSLLLRTYKGLSIFDTVIVRPVPVNVENQELIPTGFYLNQNYPNPFNPATTIIYSVPVNTTGEQAITLIIYDILGRKIKTIVNGKQTPGTYEIKFEAGSLASGMYIYRLQAGNYILSRKMIILK